uniref:Parvin gamma n=1 Tax=Nothoprocta perdicaria TaxID=30464 RepID=A0A8C6Z0G9_NOTPE
HCCETYSLLPLPSNGLLRTLCFSCQMPYFPPQFLIDWINTTLKQEHIVVKSLEEDLFDGLVLHHLLGSLKLDVDKIALTEKKQRQKLSVILEAVAKCLRLEENQLKWSVESILSKDLLSTLHLLVAIAKHFQPDLAIPANVQVETMTIEVIIVFVFATVDHRILSQGSIWLELGRKVAGDAFDELFNHAPDRLDAVKQVFADGVILLLLIGQLEGYFLNLRDFFLTPASPTEMVGPYLVTKAVVSNITPLYVVKGDMKTTLRLLYCLYSKYKTKET